MSQFDSDAYVDTISGSQLASDLNSSFAAEQTNHSGTSRPSYAVAGMTWLDTTGTPWLWKMYDGSGDITLGAINATVDSFALQDKDGDTKIQIEEAADDDIIRFDTAGSERGIFNAAGAFFIGGTANANMTQGATFFQGANDDEILALGSSDVDHGVTDDALTTIFGNFAKISGADGGLLIKGLTQGALGFLAHSIVTTEITTDTSASTGALRLKSNKKSGTGTGALGATANIFSLDNNNTTVMLVKGNGDVHQTTDAHTALDGLDDALVIRAFDLETADPATIVETQWDEFLTDRKELLIEAGILPRMTEKQIADGERPLFNASQLQRLHNGAIWQQAAQFRAVINAIVEEIPQLKTKIENALKAAGVGHIKVLAS